MGNTLPKVQTNYFLWMEKYGEHKNGIAEDLKFKLQAFTEGPAMKTPDDLVARTKYNSSGLKAYLGEVLYQQFNLDFKILLDAGHWTDAIKGNPAQKSQISNSARECWISGIYLHTKIRSLGELKHALETGLHRLLEENNRLGTTAIDAFCDAVGGTWTAGLSHSAAASLQKAGIRSQEQLDSAMRRNPNLHKRYPSIGPNSLKAIKEWWYHKSGEKVPKQLDVLNKLDEYITRISAQRLVSKLSTARDEGLIGPDLARTLIKMVERAEAPTKGVPLGSGSFTLYWRSGLVEELTAFVPLANERAEHAAVRLAEAAAKASGSTAISGVRLMMPGAKEVQCFSMETKTSIVCAGEVAP